MPTKSPALSFKVESPMIPRPTVRIAIALLLLPAVFAHAQSLSTDWRPRLDSRAGYSVDTATGAFIQEINLVSLQGARSLDLTLTYNSGLTSHMGDVGRGWTHQYEASIDAAGGTLDPGGIYSYVNANLDALHKTEFNPEDYPKQEVWNAGLDYHDRLTRSPEPERLWELERLSGVRYWFDGYGRLTNILDRKRYQLTVERYEAGDLAGHIFQVQEPITQRSISFTYRRKDYLPTDPDRGTLLNYVTYGEGSSHLRFLKYDDKKRLSRIYDPVQMKVAGENSTAMPVIEGAAGVDFPVVVANSDSNRLIRIFGDISGGAPGSLKVELISPGGTVVTVPYERTHPNHTTMFPINFILDDFFDESIAGTWKLHVTDNTGGISHTIRSLTIYAADDPANWTQYEYQAYPSRRITRATDSKGDQIYANVYDSAGRVVTQFDGNGGFWRFTYEKRDGGGFLTKVFSRIPDHGFGPPRPLATYVHDANFNLLSVEDAIGNQTEYQYKKGSIDRSLIIDARAHLTQFFYDTRGQLTSVWEPNLAQTSFQHVSGFLVGVTDALKFRSTFGYDQFGRLITITNPLGISQSRQYSENGELTYTINKNGNGIEYQYTDGMPTSAFVITDETNVDRVEYDSLGRMTKWIDPDGNFTTITYDNRGNIVAQANAEGEVIRSTYDHRNRLVSEQDPRGNLTTYTYDRNNNVRSITNQLGETTVFSHDAEDRLSSMENPTGDTTARHEYDKAGRVTRETIGSDSFAYSYDAMGNRIRIIGNSGVTISETEYDATNRPISVTDARGQTTRFEYDLLGQQVKRMEPQLVGEGQSPEGNPITFKFDGMNRVESVTDKLGRTVGKTFEDDDVVKELVNAAGRKTTFSYTDRNQLARITTPGNFTTRIEYTGSGFLHRYIPPTANRTQEYSYDLAGRLVRTKHIGTTTPDILYDYDASGNRIRVSTQPGGSGTPEVKIVRNFDAVNRLTSNRDAANQTVAYAYNIVGQVSEITYPDGKKVKYTYDPAGRIETVTDWADRVTRYTWGEGDQIMLIRFPNGTVRVMEYSDNLFLLSRADYDADGAVIVRYAYTYDINGFISAEQVEGPPPVAYAPADVSYAYDDDNRLINISGVNVGFDDDGNVVNGPVGGQPTTMTWDQRNNLSKAGSVVYRYDPEDRLVGWVDGSETVDLTVVEASDGSRILVSTSSAGPVARYVYGVGLAYEEIDGQIRVLHYDERGNTTAFSDPSGKVSGRLTYSPYGAVIAASGDTSGLFGYGGLFGVVAAPDGLNYMRFRWYSPEMKRFISMDSNLGDITLPFSLNRYIYAGSNPLNFNDPEGEWVNIVVGAIGGAILGATVEIVSSELQGKPINWNKVAAAAIGGAIHGGFAAAGGVGLSVIGGAYGSFSEDVANAAFSGSGIDAGNVLIGAAVGGAAGGVGAKIGGFLKGQWSKQVALDAKLSGNFSKPLVDRLTNSAFKKAATYEAKKNALKFSPRLMSDFLEDQVDFTVASNNSPQGSPDVSRPPGRVGAIIEGATRMPTSHIGKGGEYLHYQRYLEALNAAGRPLPDPPESLATF